ARGPQGFDVIVVDAFSGDSIPMHLMTREALALYARHLAPGGVVAFHISNRHLALAPVVRRLADTAGLQARRVHHVPDADSPALEHTSEYVLLSRDAGFIEGAAMREHGEPIEASAAAPWSDDHANLLAAMRWTPR
ncbi:hypothetical protein ACEN8K_44760, partial [Variovorax sp. CT11-76]